MSGNLVANCRKDMLTLVCWNQESVLRVAVVVTSHRVLQFILAQPQARTLGSS